MSTQSPTWHDPTNWNDELEGISGAWVDQRDTIPASVINGIIANLLFLHANIGTGGGAALGDRVLQVVAEGDADAGDSSNASREDHAHGLPVVTGGALGFDATDHLMVVASGIATAMLAAEAVTSEKLANQAVTGRKIAGNVVASGHLVNSAIINTVRIFNNAVTSEKIAANTINNGHMRDDAINTVEIVDGAVTLAKLATEVRTAISAGVTPQQIATAVNAYLQANPPSGTDQNARDAAAAAMTAAMNAATAAAAAQLDTDTVIEIGPHFVHNQRTAFVMGVSLRHPLNAYSSATILQVRAANSSPVLVEYDNTVLEQQTLVEISAVAMGNLWDAQRAIPDGMGGTRNVQRYSVGTYVPVEIRLRIGRNGDTVFFRLIDVLVVDALGSDVDQQARTAAANALNTARAAATAAQGAQTTADSKQTAAQVTTIADARAAARFTDAEKTALANRYTFVRYANEAALPANVPANTVAWYPAS